MCEQVFEQSVIHNSTSDTNKTGSFYVDSPASKLLLSLYCLDAQKIVNVISFKLFQPNGLRNETNANAIVFEDIYAFILESASEALPLVTK